MGQKDSKPRSYSLSSSEIDDVARDTNAKPQDIKAVLKAFSKISTPEGRDKDGNNEIDFREFVMAMQYMSTSSSLLDAIDTAFASFDLNNDGGISREEMRAVYRSQKRMTKYINVFKRQKPLQEINLDPRETVECHDTADRCFDKVTKTNADKISKDEFKAAVESDAELRAEFQKLLLGASEGKEIFSGTAAKK